MKIFSSTIYRLVLIAFVILFLSQCGGAGFKKIEYSQTVTPKIKSDFTLAEKAYFSRRLDSALKQFESFIALYPYNKLTDEAFYKVAKIHFLRKEWSKANQALENLATKTKIKSYQAKAHLMLAHIAFLNQQDQKSFAWLEKTDENQLIEKLKLRYFSLFIFLGEKQAAPQSKAIYALLKLVDTYNENPNLKIKRSALNVINHQIALKRLNDWVHQETQTEIYSWFTTYPKGQAHGSLLFKWGQILLKQNKNAKAAEKFKKLVKQYPYHSYRHLAQKKLAQLGIEINVKKQTRIKVGVLLPLSGNQGVFGQRVLDGIDCARGLKPNCQKLTQNWLVNTSVIEFIVKDTVTNDIPTIIQELVQEDVVAIIGPLSNQKTYQAIEALSGQEIILLPISQTEKIQAPLGYVFQVGYPLDMQAKHLATAARKKRFQNVAIFHPESAYGQIAAHFFEEAAKEIGLEVKAKSFFDPASYDLPGEARKLKMETTTYSIGSQGLTYRALFLPDNAYRASRLSQALSFVGVRSVALMGLAAYNHEKLDLSLAKDFPGSFFIDLYSSLSSKSQTQQFITAFNFDFGDKPTTLSALGFDAASFLAQAYKNSPGNSSKKIEEGFRLMQSFLSVTQIQGFNGHRPIIQPLIIQITEDGLKISR